MGWNSWNRFACDVSERLIKETADAMVATGMKDAGYEYVVIYDCWQVDRDAMGRIVADPQRFPSGMKTLADYVHAKGLKFGLYSDAGTQTCEGRPGSKGHEEIDAKTYAEWGVDYLKYDWCHAKELDARDAYGRMSRALRAAGQPIVFSICEWGLSKPWLWAQGIGHLWRTTGDIQDCWDCGRGFGTLGVGMGVVHIIDLQEALYPYNGPGHWNDPDMLEVGNGGLSAAESRALQLLGSLRGAAHRGQRPADDLEGDDRDPHAAGGDRSRPGFAWDPGAEGQGQRAPRSLDEATCGRLTRGHPVQPRNKWKRRSRPPGRTSASSPPDTRSCATSGRRPTSAFTRVATERKWNRTGSSSCGSRHNSEEIAVVDL